MREFWGYDAHRGFSSFYGRRSGKGPCECPSEHLCVGRASRLASYRVGRCQCSRTGVRDIQSSGGRLLGRARRASCARTTPSSRTSRAWMHSELGRSSSLGVDVKQGVPQLVSRRYPARTRLCVGVPVAILAQAIFVEGFGRYSTHRHSLVSRLPIVLMAPSAPAVRRTGRLVAHVNDLSGRGCGPCPRMGRRRDWRVYERRSRGA